LQLLFWGVLKRALEKLSLSISDLKGTFRVDSTVPIGANLGASATLCAAIAKWCVAQGFISEEKTIEFGRELEHIFHEQSSGIDIMLSLSQQLTLFQQGDPPQIKHITPCWQPLWYLSSSKQPRVTADCVKQVKALWEREPKQAAEIDNLMHQSVLQSVEALMLPQKEGFPHLINAINQAAHCFKQWDLVPQALKQHIDWLKQHGASAVKPTGAGGGGYVLSLWETPPPASILSVLFQA
jgi:mevalonate kinase